ncbi:MAG: hypothetical protein IJH04_05285 [Eggerthellaceae bacterium]|nr:hypothetical protein [Eggerthellaceae bacterium]
MPLKPFSHADAYQVLWLQLADEGRIETLLGDNAKQARTAALPFLLGEKFPSVYLEIPLKGKPFLDVTVLYNRIEPDARILSDAAAGTERLLDWCASSVPQVDDISFGFELDTHEQKLPQAAVHFQPRRHLELVEPFCAAAGESEKAHLYLDLAKRMPSGWDLSFFGLFRGRPDSPLRVCGYLSQPEKDACSLDPNHLASVFDEIGFSAYDDDMLEQASELLAKTPKDCDFQFDVYPDGSLGDTFAIDSQLRIEQPKALLESLEHGALAELINVFEKWGTVDDRWRIAADAAFARALPVELEDGSLGRFSLTLLPHWVKTRWRNGVLQPAKLYYLASADLFEEPESSK